MDCKFEIAEPKSEEEITKEKFKESLNPAIFLLKELLEESNFI